MARTKMSVKMAAPGANDAEGEAAQQETAPPAEMEDQEDGSVVLQATVVTSVDGKEGEEGASEKGEDSGEEEEYVVQEVLEEKQVKESAARLPFHACRSHVLLADAC